MFIFLFFVFALCIMLMHALVIYLFIYFVIISFTWKCRCETTGMSINNTAKLSRACAYAMALNIRILSVSHALDSLRDSNSINVMNAIMRNLYATKITCAESNFRLSVSPNDAESHYLYVYFFVVGASARNFTYLFAITIA